MSPLGLGGLTYGLSTVEMAAAYAAFANSGVYNEPKTYVKVLANDNATVVLEKETRAAGGHEGDHRLFDDDQLLPGRCESSGTGGGARFSGMTHRRQDRYHQRQLRPLFRGLHALLLRGGLGGL